MLDLESLSPGPFALVTAVGGLFAAALMGIALGDPAAAAFAQAVPIAAGVGIAVFVLRRREAR